MGWAFNSRLSLNGMNEGFDASGSKPWAGCDSERHGDYLGIKLTEEAVARIYSLRNGRFVVNLRFLSRDGNSVAQLTAAVDDLLTRVRAILESRDVRSTDPVE